MCRGCLPVPKGPTLRRRQIATVLPIMDINFIKYYKNYNLLKSSATLMLFAYYFRHFCSRCNDPDLWGRMAVGRLFFEHGGMPRRDPFSYSPSLPEWNDHEWLSGVFFYWVHDMLGEP